MAAAMAAATATAREFLCAGKIRRRRVLQNVVHRAFQLSLGHAAMGVCAIIYHQVRRVHVSFRIRQISLEINLIARCFSLNLQRTIDGRWLTRYRRDRRRRGHRNTAATFVKKLIQRRLLTTADAPCGARPPLCSGRRRKQLVKCIDVKDG